MKNNKKGFTLAELLVVVAIIAVLVAIAIPVFSGALTKAQEAADEANLRAAYAKAVTNYLVDNTSYPSAYSGPALNKSYYTWSVRASGLYVKYSATKIDPLELKGGVLN